MENVLNRTYYPTQSYKVLSNHHLVGCRQINSENKIDKYFLGVDNCSAFKLTLLKMTGGISQRNIWKYPPCMSMEVSLEIVRCGKHTDVLCSTTRQLLN